MGRKGIRNVGIIAHIDAGKTSLTEKLLQRSGVIRYAGEVSEGTTVTDWLLQERERGISIISAAVTCPWDGCQINLVDTPGHVDFTAEVERTLQILDGVVAVFCGVHGVQAQSETVWRRAHKHGVPVIAFVNKLDRLGADFERVVSEIEARFGVKAVAMQVPVGREDGFRGMADALTGCLVDESGAVVEDLSGSDEVAFARYAVLDALSEVDEGILEDVLEGREPSAEKIRQAMAGAVKSRSIVPVFGGSVRMGIGVKAVLDGICDYLPEAGGGSSEIQPRQMLVFKVQQEPGDSCVQICVRAYGGGFKTGDSVWNSRARRWMTLESVNRLCAGMCEPLESCCDGDIVMVTSGDADVMTGDVLLADAEASGCESMSFPEPVVGVALEGTCGTDSAALAEGLRRMCQADPTLRYYAGQLAGQWILEGMGELHLDVVVDRLRSDFGLSVAKGKPQVSCRKTVTAEAEGECHFEKRLVTGEVQRAGIKLKLVPLERGAGLEVDFGAVAGGVSEALGEFVESTLRQLSREGLDDEKSLTDVRLVLEQLDCFEGETTAPALTTACRRALSEALSKGGSLVLEPVMSMEIALPEEHVGKVLDDLMARRGRVSEVASAGMSTARIIALVPLGELFGYASSLRSLSCGRGDFAAEPSGYVPVQSC